MAAIEQSLNAAPDWQQLTTFKDDLHRHQNSKGRPDAQNGIKPGSTGATELCKNKHKARCFTSQGRLYNSLQLPHKALLTTASVVTALPG